MRRIAILLALLLIPLANASDANGDGRVDMQDLLLVTASFGRSMGFDARADANGDGRVDLFDLVRVARSYGVISGGLPSGLVASYSFEPGLVPADSSGFGRTLSLVGATSDVGRYGGGLFLDGASYAELPEESAFDFTGPFSVTFWMRSDGWTIDWESLVAKGDSSWFVTRSGTSGSVAFGTFTPAANDLSAAGPFDDGAWHHVAAVYNGTHKVVFVDGVVSAQTPFVASVSTNDQPVRLGHNSEFPRFFTGWLDEVRIYDRGLSAGEVRDDLLRHGDGSLAPDTFAPIRSGGQPSGVLSSGTTNVTVSLTTDEDAECRYATAAGTIYDSMAPMSVTGGTSHSLPVAGLTDGNSYARYVRCQDAVGNTNPDDYVIGFSVSSPGAVGNLPDIFIVDHGVDGLGTWSEVVGSYGLSLTTDPTGFFGGSVADHHFQIPASSQHLDNHIYQALNGIGTRGTYAAMDFVVGTPSPGSDDMQRKLIYFKGDANYGSIPVWSVILKAEGQHLVVSGDPGNYVNAYTIGSPANISFNHPYRVELYVYVNDPGQSNGVIRAWLTDLETGVRTQIVDAPSRRVDERTDGYYRGSVDRIEMGHQLDNGGFENTGVSGDEHRYVKRKMISTQEIGLWGLRTTPLLFSDDFSSGDLTRAENGFSWAGESSSVTVGIDSLTGSEAMRLRLSGNAPGDDWAEERFGAPQRDEYWIEWELTVPANFDLTTGTNGNHQKFFALWGADYGVAGRSKVVIELWRTGTGQAMFRFLHNPDGSVSSYELTSGQPAVGPAGPLVPGQKHRIRLHVDVGTAARNDGVYQFWVDDALILNRTDVNLWGGSDNYFDQGYFMGYKNGGYSQQTDYYVDNVKVYDSDPGWD